MSLNIEHYSAVQKSCLQISNKFYTYCFFYHVIGISARFKYPSTKLFFCLITCLFVFLVRLKSSKRLSFLVQIKDNGLFEFLNFRIVVSKIAKTIKNVI